MKEVTPETHGTDTKRESLKRKGRGKMNAGSRGRAVRLTATRDMKVKTNGREYVIVLDHGVICKPNWWLVRKVVGKHSSSSSSSSSKNSNKENNIRNKNCYYFRSKIC